MVMSLHVPFRGSMPDHRARAHAKNPREVSWSCLEHEQPRHAGPSAVNKSRTRELLLVCKCLRVHGHRRDLPHSTGPQAGQIFRSLLCSGIFANTETLMEKKQTKHLIFFPLNFWEDFHGTKPGEPFRSKHCSDIKSK